MQKTSATISDFDLSPYMKSNGWIASWQLFTVLAPYFGLWYAAYVVHDSTPWLVVLLAVAMVMVLMRSFALMHDCGHHSLFRRKIVNRSVGFLLGVVNGLPQYPWSRGHNYHHKHNGNWEMYRGPAAVISVDDFVRLSPFGQWMYAALRHPLMLFPGGLFYLIVKPRVQLIGGLVTMIPSALKCLVTGDFRRLLRFESKWWYTTGEFWDILLNNICVIGVWIVAGELMGHALFWMIYAPVMMFAAAIFICVFYIQHNYEDSYAHRTEGWSYVSGALEGSSFFKLPAVLNWFTADIGYHNIHHLCSRIPNYHLAACHRANAALLEDVKVLRMRDIPTCYGYILWDADNDCLTTVADVKASIGTATDTCAGATAP